MLNKDDKKNIVVVILVLIIIMGILIACRSSHDSQLATPNESNNQEPTIVIPTDEEKEENQGQSEDISNEKPIVNVNSSKPVVKEEEKNPYPKIDIEQTYYTVSLGEDFSLPQISSLEDSEDSLVVNITYSFQAFDSNEFYPVLEFSTEKLGTYKITYHVENQNHYVSRLDIFVEIVDTTNPIVEGIISRYNAAEDITEYIAVSSGSYINQSIDISFWDDDIVSYAEYYNAQEDNTIIGDTLEQEAMPTLIPVDINSTLTLTESGEYHIRVYDRSGNITEYVVIIDLEPPTIDVRYEQIDDDLVLVTITSLEELKPLEGWELSEDFKILTKIYSTSILENVCLMDLAENQVSVSLAYEGIHAEIMQNHMITESRYLNQNDGVISLNVTGRNLGIVYSLDDGELTSYSNGSVLTQDGYYRFQITDGNYTMMIEFTISSMGTSD